MQFKNLIFVGRKAILFMDDSKYCKKARKILQKAKIDFVEYNVNAQLELGCCDGFTTQAPSVFAPEGIFRGISEIRNYVKMLEGRGKKQIESESAYW